VEVTTSTHEQDEHIIMGLLHLVEDRPTPKAVYNWRVYTAACVASWAACMIGYDSACKFDVDCDVSIIILTP